MTEDEKINKGYKKALAKSKGNHTPIIIHRAAV